MNEIAIDRPPTKAWLRERVESLLGGPLAANQVRLNNVMALVDAYTRRMADDAYEQGYADGTDYGDSTV